MKKLLSFVAAVLFAATSFAQVDEVTLITIGNGRTEDEATLRALRNALEQTFGTFVSANTSIINDELARDEIAATSKGNVKEYKKLSVVKLPDRTTTVTLKATVSINKLISYARNNGSQAEFAGQTYAMNVKLLKLQQQNADKTLEVMKDNILALCHNVFDYNIELGQVSKYRVYTFLPNMLKGNEERLFSDDLYEYSLQYYLPLKLDIYATDVTTNIYLLYNETLNAIRLSRSMVDEFDRNGLARTSDYLPVSESKIYKIRRAIVQAILLDLWKVKLRKINDTEYYSFSEYEKNFSVCLLEKLEMGGHCTKIYRMYPANRIWLVSNNTPSIISYSYVEENYNAKDGWNGISHRNKYDEGEEAVEGLVTCNTLGKNSQWNTMTNGQIYQEKLKTFNLCILLTDDELERFQGFELVGVSSPKHTNKPQSIPNATTQKSSKQEYNTGYEKMSDLPLNTPIKLNAIRVLTGNLPKKTYTISMSSKGSNGQQTYKIHIGEKRVEGQFGEFNGDAFASAFPNAIITEETKDYIDMKIVMGEYTIKKFPKELADCVYVQLNK